MAELFVRHKVKDYPKWKSLFDEHAAKKKAAGSKGGRLFRSEKAPHEVVILFEWQDLGGTNQFGESGDLRQRMERPGVVGKPELYFLDEIEKLTV
jgi:hypothetical protein